MKWINRRSRRPKAGQKVLVLQRYYAQNGLRENIQLSIYDHYITSNQNISKRPQFLLIEMEKVPVEAREDVCELYAVTHWIPYENLEIPVVPPVAEWLKMYPNQTHSVIYSLGSFLDQ